MTNKMMKYTSGFTLIETMVAVLLLSVAIGGPLTIASKGLVIAQTARNQVSAYFLAQDAVEFVRFARDTNLLNSTNWLSGTVSVSPCVSADGSAACYLDSLLQTPATPTACSGTCVAMNYDVTTGLYNYNTSNRTSPYTRRISITSPVAGNTNEASVVVTVGWVDNGGIARSVVLRETIFNWQ